MFSVRQLHKVQCCWGIKCVCMEGKGFPREPGKSLRSYSVYGEPLQIVNKGTNLSIEQVFVFNVNVI